MSNVTALLQALAKCQSDTLDFDEKIDTAIAELKNVTPANGFSMQHSLKAHKIVKNLTELKERYHDAYNK